jgi:RimJ/RimL family protein N-acetyltransferase
MNLFVTPAKVEDVWAFLGERADFPLTGGPRFYRHLLAQTLQGLAFAVWREHRCIALAGIFIFDDRRPAEGWLAMSPDASRSMVALVRAIRRALAELGEEAQQVIVRVDPGNERGQRLARLAGFQPIDEGIWQGVRHG